MTGYVSPIGPKLLELAADHETEARMCDAAAQHVSPYQGAASMDADCHRDAAARARLLAEMWDDGRTPLELALWVARRAADTAIGASQSEYYGRRGVVMGRMYSAAARIIGDALSETIDVR